MVKVFKCFGQHVLDKIKYLVTFLLVCAVLIWIIMDAEWKVLEHFQKIVTIEICVDRISENEKFHL